jgi:hypothetical protein
LVKGLVQADEALVRIESILSDADARRRSVEIALDFVLQRFDAVQGAVHRLEQGSAVLELVAVYEADHAAAPLPPPTVPVGVGMVGLAAQSAGTVQAVDLPLAVEPRGSCAGIAIPIKEGATLLGVLSLGKAAPHRFLPDEVEALREVSSVLVGYLLE